MLTWQNEQLVIRFPPEDSGDADDVDVAYHQTWLAGEALAGAMTAVSCGPDPLLKEVDLDWPWLRVELAETLTEMVFAKVTGVRATLRRGFR